MNKSVIYFLLIIFVLGVLYVYYFLKTDTIVFHASQQYLFGKEQIYVLKQNDGNDQIPAGITYVIVNPDQKDTHIDFGISGTVVGKTDVDLVPYVGKRVQIEGYHYDGRPLLLTTKGLPEQYMTSNMAVIHIKKIKSIE